jgi:pentatricopeptide repeat protein
MNHEKSRIRELNNQISLFARRKQLLDADLLFETLKSEKIANSHSFAAILNAHVRCGDIQGAKIIFDSIFNRNENFRMIKPDVILCTTMLKGFCSSYDIVSAEDLFKNMLKKSIIPNIRTINTLLRGYLNMGSVEQARKLLKKTNELSIAVDVSTYEYVVALLCQGLQLDQVFPLIGRIKSDSNIKSGMAIIFYHAARATALLGEWKQLRKLIQNSTDRLDDMNEENLNIDSVNDSSSKATIGGKRAWREIDDSRQESLNYYQLHKREELQRELQILKLLEEKHSQKSVKLYRSFIFHFLIKVFMFPYGLHKDRLSRAELISSFLLSYQSCYGIRTLLDIFNISVDQSIIPSTDVHSGSTSNLHKVSKKKKKFNKSINLILEQIKQWLSKCVNEHGFLSYDFMFSQPKIFSDEIEKTADQPRRKVKVEICSGAGDWVVSQAIHDSDSNWIAIELRNDRVYSILMKAISSEANNLCMLRGDAALILGHIPPNSVDAVCINYPEPPQKTGKESSEASHLLQLVSIY